MRRPYGRNEITATPNHSRKTFTIRTQTRKYRTIRMTKEEFESSLNDTPRDWRHFLNVSTDYYEVK